MSFSFGLGTLQLLRNLEITGVQVLTGSSAGAAERVQINSGLVMIDGITAIVSGQSASFSVLTGGINTGSGLLVYSYLDSTSTVTITASIGILSAADPLNTASNIPTAICPLARFSFGTGALSVGTFVKWSGGSATKTIGKVQNISINPTVSQSVMRGGGDIYPVDIKHFDGECNFSFEFADPTSSHNLFMGGVYVSGGNTSGTWTLSGTQTPEPMSLLFQVTTNGVTSTYTLMKAFITSQSNEFTRTGYLQPTYEGVAIANQQGTVLRIVG